MSEPNEYLTFLTDEPHGFLWESASNWLRVHRIAHFMHRKRDKGPYLILGVDVGVFDIPDLPRHKIEICASPTGATVRVYMDGKELK
jgi:hypothetical protein